MRALTLLVVTLLMAACTSSPIAPHNITFTGDYIDARSGIAAKIRPLHKEPLPAPLREPGPHVSAVIAFIVEMDGRTSEVQIVSATDRAFAQAVCESVSGWRYAPPMKDGKPVRIALEEEFGVRLPR